MADKLKPFYEVLTEGIISDYADSCSGKFHGLCGMLMKMQIPQEALSWIEQKLTNALIEISPPEVGTKENIEKLQATIMHIKQRQKEIGGSE